MRSPGKILVALTICLSFGSCGGTSTGGGNKIGDEACKKIDVVFSVDDSGSMTEEKDAIANTVFPAFAQELINVADGLDDFRVGVLDACAEFADFHVRGDGGQCNFDSGERWMTSASSDLVGEFQCVGDIYTGDYGSGGNTCDGSNDDEQPASTIVAALSDPFIGNQNSGFLRSDALLVVIAITDEDEQPTDNASAQEIYDRLVSIKGDVHRMVFLGIGGGSNCNGVYGSAIHATKLQDITDLFSVADRGVFWDLCDGNLEDGLDEALTHIDSACEELPQYDPEL